MKITKEVWSCGELERIQEFRSISDAVEDAAFKDTDALIGRLVEAMCDGGMPASALKHVLGPGYEVNE